MNKEQQLKALAETISKAQKQMEEINNEKIDFSKFVEGYGTSLVIKWERWLVSHMNWDISYMKYDCTTKTLDYTHTTVGELERGDVFICEDEVDRMELESFNIYVQKWVVQYLSKYCTTEVIDNYEYSTDTEVIAHHVYSTDTKVIKFLRT